LTEIKFKDEADLQRKILAILNKKENGFNFEIVPHDFDLIDTVHKIYIEVKPENFAPAQILYALAKREKKDIKYIGLACAFEARFYKSPSLMSILSFAKEIDPLLSQSPSSVNQKKYEEKAFELLGDHFAMYPYDGKLDLSNPVQYIFVDQENYEYFKKLFEKYDIDSAKFLPFIADIYAKNQEIDINNNGLLKTKYKKETE
jgi:hypothetical protein